jgi:hypothetical protein
MTCQPRHWTGGGPGPGHACGESRAVKGVRRFGLEESKWREGGLLLSLVFTRLPPFLSTPPLLAFPCPTPGAHTRPPPALGGLSLSQIVLCCSDGPRVFVLDKNGACEESENWREGHGARARSNRRGRPSSTPKVPACHALRPPLVPTRRWCETLVAPWRAEYGDALGEKRVLSLPLYFG